MTRKIFDQSLQNLEQSILVLAGMVEDALINAVQNLKEQDVAAARKLIAEDHYIDERRYAIEAECLTLIATQQPMAVDMRTLAATLFIANELERIGDYAKGISRVTKRIGHEPHIKPLIDIPRMREHTTQMLHRSLEAFVRQDITLARAIIEDDQFVDDLYDQVYRELMTFVIQDVKMMRQANLLLFVAHNLERAADRVTNICERVIYCVTGELVDTGWDEDDVP